MPPDQETPTVTPEGGNASPTAEEALAAIVEAKAGTETEPKSSPLAEYLKDEANRAEFTALSLEIVQPHFDALKESHEQRLRSLQGQLSHADLFKGVTPEGRETLMDAQVNREDAIAAGVEKGISKKVLEQFSTPRAVREFVQVYQSEMGAPKPAASTNGANSELKAVIEAALTERLGSKTEPMATGSGILPSQVNNDNIDALHLEGKVTDEQYRTFLGTGQV